MTLSLDYTLVHSPDRNGLSLNPRDINLVPFEPNIELDPKLISQVAPFAELTKMEQRAVLKQMHVRRFRPNETIFTHYSISDAFYLIQSGCIKLISDYETEVPTILGPGSLFGNSDFFQGRCRTETAWAITEVIAWSLEQQAFSRIVTEQPTVALHLGLALRTDIIQFRPFLAEQLVKVPLLQHLSDGQRRLVARYLTPYGSPPGQTIYRRGDPPRGIFFIESGTIWLSDGGELAFRELLPGDSFGEKAVICNTPHSFTVRSATETILWFLSPAAYAALEQTAPTIASCLCSQCCS